MRCLFVIVLAKSSTLATPVVGASRIFSSDDCSCFISSDSDDSDDVDSLVSTWGCGVDITGEQAGGIRAERRREEDSSDRKKKLERYSIRSEASRSILVQTFPNFDQGLGAVVLID